LGQLRDGLCMCAIQRVNVQDKIFTLSAFELGMVVGARRTGLSVSRTATMLCFSHSTVSRVFQEWSTSQCFTTVGSIGVNMGQHGNLLTPSRVHTPTN
jgi:hypothetical protein